MDSRGSLALLVQRVQPDRLGLLVKQVFLAQRDGQDSRDSLPQLVRLDGRDGLDFRVRLDRRDRLDLQDMQEFRDHKVHLEKQAGLDSPVRLGQVIRSILPPRLQHQ